MNTKSVLLLGFWVLLTPAHVLPAEIMIPRGTVIFGELDERITSNTRKFRVGYEVDGHVWKDVIVGGQTVIPAGTPMTRSIPDTWLHLG